MLQAHVIGDKDFFPICGPKIMFDIIMLGEAIALPVNGRNPKAVQEALKRGNIKLVPFEKADPFGSVPGFPAYLSTTVRN